MFLQNLGVKLRYLLWPFLRLWLFFNVGVGLAVAGLVWWQKPLQDLPAGSLSFWLPLLLAAVVVFPGLWNSFGLIRDTGRTRSLLPLLAIGTLATAAGSLTSYVSARLAPVCRLPALHALGHYVPARYYLAAHARLNPAAWRSQSGIYTATGKHPHAIFYLALTCPAVAPSGAAPRPAAWVGFYYQHDTSATRVSAASVSNRHFLAQSRQAFQRDARQPCAYFERWPADQAGTHVRASLGSTSPVAGRDAVVLRPVYTSFAERGQASLALWVTTQVLGLGLFGLALLLLPLHKTRTRQLLTPAAPPLNQPFHS